jgi:competence protein ComEC
VAKVRRGCAPAVFLILLVVGAVGGYFGWQYYRQTQPPPASGTKELRVHVLDVGQTDGDSILIISPEDKVVLVDAGDVGKGKKVLDALKRLDVKKIDYFIATHSHADHIGGAPEVLSALPIGNVIDTGQLPPEMQPEETPAEETKGKGKKKAAQPKKPSTTKEPLSVTAYRNYKDAADRTGAKYEKATPEMPPIDLGGGAILTVLAPTEPLFTRAQMKSGGSEPNANSIVLRLDYGDFSMLLAGDAEAQTEDRLIAKDTKLAAKILKVAHHGSRYATSENFVKTVKPEVAIISDGEYNRYGHPSQDVLTRLKDAGAKLYRTDLQGTITITTKGRVEDNKLYEIKTEKEAKSDLWAGREGQYDDSSRRGFIAYGDFGPPPKPPKEKTATKKK